MHNVEYNFAHQIRLELHDIRNGFSVYGPFRHKVMRSIPHTVLDNHVLFSIHNRYKWSLVGRVRYLYVDFVYLAYFLQQMCLEELYRYGRGYYAVFGTCVDVVWTPVNLGEPTMCGGTLICHYGLRALLYE